MQKQIIVFKIALIISATLYAVYALYSLNDKSPENVFGLKYQIYVSHLGCFIFAGTDDTSIKFDDIID